MKRFYKTILIFLIPFFIYLLLVVIIDPYNYLSLFPFLDSYKKNEIAENIENHLYYIINYQNNPSKNIILGDSRSQLLIHLLESETWKSLAYGGGTLKEMIQTFWWVVEHNKLDTVLMGINLNLYNKYNKRFWVEDILEIRKNFISYAFCSYTYKSIVQFLKYSLSNREITLGIPDMSKEEFWDFQINQTAKKYFERYEYPDEYYANLKSISEYCLKHNIKLIFWIPPTHIEFQKRKEDFNLQKYDSLLVSDLKSLGEQHDFNYISKLAVNKENFGDPLHFNGNVDTIIFSELFSNTGNFSKYYNFFN